MARTAKGRQLTEDHRKEQAAIGLSLRKWILSLFRKTIDYADIDRSSQEFARRAAPKVLQYRNLSRMLSEDYLGAFAEVEDDTHSPVLDVPDFYEQVDAYEELLGTTRGVLKAVSKRGYGTEDAIRAGESAVAGRATRIVQDGGRRVLEVNVERGRGPIGYARVVDADPCPFCAMLASRGVSYTGALRDGAGLYRSDSFMETNSRFAGGGRFKVHDHCECTLEPVYKVDGRLKLPGNGDELAREWAEIAASEPDAMAAWRRWRESGTLPESYDGPLEGTRRKRPVRGHRDGQREMPQPMKASERGSVKKQADWTADDFLDYADEMQRMVTRVDAEIADLKDAGQSDRDISVMTLAARRAALLSRIERYRAHALKM